MPRPTKTRISLADLESVEIPQAALDTDAAPETADLERAPDDSAELSSLPAGVSPEVARLLGATEAAEPSAESDPEAAAELTAVAPPAAKKPVAGRYVLALVVLGAAVAAAVYSARPPEMDPTVHTATEPTPTAPRAHEAEVGFQRIPDPVVVEAAPAPTAQPARRRVPGAPARVRGEDLF